MSPPESKTVPPPAYNTLKPSDDEVAKIERYWEHKRPKDWRMTGKSNLVFSFAPKPSQTWNLRPFCRDHQVQPAWKASLWVWADNIPRLMRQGFYWSLVNISKAEGRVHLDTRVPSLKPMWKHTRVYVLRDISPNPQWSAELRVYGKKASTVIDFDLGWITMSTIQKVEGWNWNFCKVYHFESGSGPCFNTIYDRMPMGGWWPWPKAPDEEASVDGGSVSHQLNQTRLELNLIQGTWVWLERSRGAWAENLYWFILIWVMFLGMRAADDDEIRSWRGVTLSTCSNWRLWLLQNEWVIRYVYACSFIQATLWLGCDCSVCEHRQSCNPPASQKINRDAIILVIYIFACIFLYIFAYILWYICICIPIYIYTYNRPLPIGMHLRYIYLYIYVRITRIQYLYLISKY